MKILLISEQREGKWNGVSFETLAAAQQIVEHTKGSLAGGGIGQGVAKLADELAAYQLDEVLLVEHDLLDKYTPDGFSLALKQVIESLKPDLVLFPHTYQVRDFAPKLAASMNKGMIGDCIDYRYENGKLIFVRQMFQGRTSADVDFTAAPILVSVGRGIKAPENIALAEKLAKAMHAEICASRPICDEGWLPMDRQIGSSGQNVAPKLFLALGISGAIQHVVGMKGARTIAAINKDQNAPIFEIADYGIVGDLFEIVPALIEEFEKSA